MNEHNYKSIKKKIFSWIDYEDRIPKSDYNKNHYQHDEFRKINDLDCILLNGDLNADTIFSLWIPLRLTLVRINGYSVLNKYGNIKNKIPFLKRIYANEETIDKLLPENNETVIKLLELFDLGQKKCNVMRLKNRGMQLRGKAPYYDYMPYFLLECFENGSFSKYFTDNNDFKDWICEQKLNMFFDGEIAKENIKDLSGSGSLKNGIPNELDYLLENYICILKQRENLIG